MRYLRLGLAILLAIIYLPACGAGKAYLNNVGSWVGAPLGELIAQWGPPHKTGQLKNGQRYYEWTQAVEHWVPPNLCLTDDLHCDPGGYYALTSCTSTVMVDPQDLIISVTPDSFLGLSNCRFLPAPSARPGYMPPAAPPLEKARPDKESPRKGYSF